MSTYYNKEETIRRHREMWNWIADRVENNSSVPLIIVSLKRQAIESLYPEDMAYILDDCYLCNYAYHKGLECGNTSGRGKCHFCPLGYRETPYPHYCLNGLYEKIQQILSRIHDRDKFIKLAREIANLPEREINNKEGN